MNRISFMTASLFLGVLMSLAPAIKGVDAPAYVGAKKCRVCHLKQYNSWSTTKMATSFELLKPHARAEAKSKAKQDPNKDYTHDVTCLPCHTTGYGKPGGFRSIEETPDLAGVQCESCHGPHSNVLKIMTAQNREYKRSEVVQAGLELPGENTCMGQCHNTKSPMVPPGYKFDYEARRKQGSHETVPLKYPHG